jgi:hypothetical protein
VSALAEVFLATLVATIVGTAFALEAQAWAPHLSRRLLRATFGGFPPQLPAQLRDRWIEEIEADAASFEDRPLGGLAFSLRLWRRGGRALAAELALREMIETESPVGS